MSMKSVRVMVLVCSTRPGALGPAIGEWFTDTVTQLAVELDANLVSVSLGELALPFLDEEEHPSSGIYHNQHTRNWSEMVDGVDAVIVVTPEYNYGMPASLKNALDYLGREWAWKPIGFVSYGNTSAGTRSVQHAKQVVTTLRLVPLGRTVSIRISEVIENGQVRANEQLNAAAAGALSETVRLAQALRPLRDAAADTSRAGPLQGSYVREMDPDDAPEVIVLQRCCWVDEAISNQSLAVPALHESIDDVRAGLREWNTTGLWRDGRLLGMVRTGREENTWHIGRLAVVPDLRGKGVGRWLLQHAVAEAEPGCERIALVTGAKSEENVRLYQSEGFVLSPGGVHDGAVELTKAVAMAPPPAADDPALTR